MRQALQWNISEKYFFLKEKGGKSVFPPLTQIHSDDFIFCSQTAYFLYKNIQMQYCSYTILKSNDYILFHFSRIAFYLPC